MMFLPLPLPGGTNNGIPPFPFPTEYIPPFPFPTEYAIPPFPFPTEYAIPPFPFPTEYALLLLLCFDPYVRLRALLLMLFPPDFFPDLPDLPLSLLMLFPPDFFPDLPDLPLSLLMPFPPDFPFPDTALIPLKPLPLPFPDGACKVVTLGGAIAPLPHRVPRALTESLTLFILSELFEPNRALILPPCPIPRVDVDF
jgi:hypothetical protein